MCLLIAANYVWCIFDNIYFSVRPSKFDIYTWVWFPFIFTLIDMFVLIGAVYRVGRILSIERMVGVNYKFVAVHCVLLFFWAVATLMASLSLGYEGETLWYWTIYSAMNSAVSCFIAIILWQASVTRDRQER
jgi:hypothetical protein